MPHRIWLRLALTMMLTVAISGCWFSDLLKPPAEVTQEYNAAKALFKQQEYARAQVGFKSFLERNPDNPLAPWAKYYLAECYFKEGLYAEATEAFEAFLLLESAPQLTQLARFDLGECYRQTGRLTDAKQQYEMVIEAGAALEGELPQNYVQKARQRLDTLGAPNSPE